MRLKAGGYTIIELLGVMVIVAILAGIVIGVFGSAAKKGDTSKAKSDIEHIRIALDEFRAEFGYYPEQDSAAGFSNLVNTLSVLQREVMEDAVEGLKYIDPWGNDYMYQRGSQIEDRFKYQIWSYGPDRITGGTPPFDIANNEADRDNISPSIQGY
ncbi:MAG: type II secretion system GspH family protein [Kiritimatiellales bacterium]|nr:type II secretion system GspH family protein [Kiritimatiellales bacterium]